MSMSFSWSAQPTQGIIADRCKSRWLRGWWARGASRRERPTRRNRACRNGPSGCFRAGRRHTPLIVLLYPRFCACRRNGGLSQALRSCETESQSRARYALEMVASGALRMTPLAAQRLAQTSERLARFAPNGSLRCCSAKLPIRTPPDEAWTTNLPTRNCTKESDHESTNCTTWPVHRYGLGRSEARHPCH